jgi:isobutyryl-CoA mutase
MTNSSDLHKSDLHKPQHPTRFITAASLFDGHDAAINIMRRILQSQGAEVIHLGHNRSVDDVVRAAVQEDVQGIAISSYQGGHMEYFTYLLERLREQGAGDTKIYGGGGGVIIQSEIEELHRRGVSHIFSPQDGQRMGLAQMINGMIAACDTPPERDGQIDLEGVFSGSDAALARAISVIEAGVASEFAISEIRRAATQRTIPTLGITGTGGSGKSSLTDELIRRFRLDQGDKLRIAVIAVDPTRRRGGGALLGDRIRMNTVDSPQVFFRSLATRSTDSPSGATVPEGLDLVILAAKAWGADLVIVETPGIGQGDTAIVPFVDLPIYVMTPEFGASTQLEKIDMLDYAEVIAINKFERRGAQDALRDVRRQYARNRELFHADLESLPIFGTVAARFNDDGITAMYQHIRDLLVPLGLTVHDGALAPVKAKVSSHTGVIVPTARQRYLADICDVVRRYHLTTSQQALVASERQHLAVTATLLEARGHDSQSVRELEHDAGSRLDGSVVALVEQWPQRRAELTADTRPTRESLSGLAIPKLSVPKFEDHGELVRWLRSENLPGYFPYTAGVFPLKREGEDPARMFAGEGGPARTNRRFKMLAEGQPATRLSTAFDSVTLYGFDPHERPDIYGKVGNSGVSIATLDDMKLLFDGFDLCDPSTSVSMTINGPAPTLLAMYLNTAIDKQIAQFVDSEGRQPTESEALQIKARTLTTVRGTVQADILKEDQGQNTCIFSTEFSLGVMADIAEYFVQNQVRNFYSVSISGYHIAEAGANPISQLAFTLANGFTYVEAYLARGMNVDDFAPNLSFFFSNGMDPEYTVLGRVARRIWAIAMRERYGANDRSQKLKYHVQTSGRSLHAQEMAFNDIRTTLQALCAIYDNANSLHTNAYDEAVTTPTSESVRRALAIQLVINREWGLSMNENPLQGSFIVEELTEMVEQAVLAELERISERGGVLAAMETGYQRGRIQDESMLYEQRKHDGTLPIVGVNTFRNPEGDAAPLAMELARSDNDEKNDQIARLRAFQERNRAGREPALDRLRHAALTGANVFEVLMDTVRFCSLGEITEALFDVGGRYRRNV